MKSILQNFKLLFLLLFIQIGFAQQKTITGTVSDSKGSPLSGANVIVVGTKNGTQTGFDGKYSIKADSGARLKVNFIGTKIVFVTVGEASNYNITLQNEDQVLEEIVSRVFYTKDSSKRTNCRKSYKRN